jgi:ATP-binding cassette, subfamily C, bacterial
MTAPDVPLADGARIRAELRHRMRPLAGRLLAAAGLTLLVTAGTFAPALLVRLAVDDGVVAGDRSTLLAAVAALAVAAALTALADGVRTRLVATIGEDVLAGLRRDLHDAIVRAPVTRLEAAGVGRVEGVASGDLGTLTLALRDALPQTVQAAAVLLAAGVVLLVLSPLLAAVVAGALPLVAVAGVRFTRRSGAVYAALRARVGDAVESMADTVHGGAVVWQHGREADRRAALAEADAAVLDEAFAAMRLRNGLFPVVALARGLATAALVGVGGALALAGEVTVGTLAAAVLVLATLFGPLEQLSQLAALVLSARAALARVLGVVGMAPAVQRTGRATLPATGTLAVHGVRFSYVPGTEVVSGVDLDVPAGGSLALVGATGAGQTTLARLLVGLDEPDAGRVTFGGVDLRDVDPAALRRRLLLVPQEGHLLGATVREVLTAAAPDADDDALADALAAVGLDGWLALSARGLDTDVRAEGAGVRQQLALARVVLVDPAAVVLDEATSALDPDDARRLDAALRRALRRRTVVVIAHRLTTAANCDAIAVVDGGRIVEAGTHTALLAADGRYAAAWRASGSTMKVNLT